MTLTASALILGFESSCDETGVAVVRCGPSGVPQLLGQALHSQIQMHQAYGGVVPELASRDHVRRAIPLAREALRVAHVPLEAVEIGRAHV